MRGVLDDPDTVVAVNFDALDEWAADPSGVYRTSHEKGTVGAASGADTRVQYEGSLGIPNDVPAELRPAAGYVIPGERMREIVNEVDAESLQYLDRRADGVPISRRDFDLQEQDVLKTDGHFKAESNARLANIYENEVRPILEQEFGPYSDLVDDLDKADFANRTEELMRPYISEADLSDSTRKIKSDQIIQGIRKSNPVYGQHTVVLDRKVLERTKVTYGDSMNGMTNFVPFQGATDQQILQMFFETGSYYFFPKVSRADQLELIAQAFADGNFNPRTIGTVNSQYLEAGIYGRFKVDDVKFADERSALRLGIRNVAPTDAG